MIKVGLTGNIGSGKTTVSKLFSMQGVPIFYADERAKVFLSADETASKISDYFGDQVIGPDGLIDRKKLASIVFSDPKKLQWLNDIIHPLVREDFRQWVNDHVDAPYVIKEAAILVETGQYQELDSLIVVTAPFELRISRVCERDGVNRSEVLKRVANQMEEDEKASRADFVINNDGQTALLPRVLAIHKKISTRATKPRDNDNR